MIKYDSIKDKKYRAIETHQFHLGYAIAKAVDWRFVKVSIEGLVTVLPGYCSDGATGAIDRHLIEEAFEHDIPCELYSARLITKAQRKQSDKRFKKQLLDDKDVSEFRANYLYQGVRKFLEVKDKILSFFR